MMNPLEDSQSDYSEECYNMQTSQMRKANKKAQIIQYQNDQNAKGGETSEEDQEQDRITNAKIKDTARFIRRLNNRLG